MNNNKFVIAVSFPQIQKAPKKLLTLQNPQYVIYFILSLKTVIASIIHMLIYTVYIMC